MEGSLELRLMDRIEIEIDSNEILGKAGSLAGRMGDVVAEVVEEGYRLIDAKAIYDFYRIRNREKGRLIIDDVIFESTLLAESLRCTDRVAVFISTIGPRLEARVSEYFSKGEYLRGWLLDNVGTYALRKTNQHLLDIVKGETGWRQPSRFSPGQNYWDISQQRILFQLLPAEKIDVKLTEHLMMVPKKSTSGVFGDTEKEFISCQICPLKCEWRGRESTRVEGEHP
jgi:hypothetical protein